MIRFQRLHTEKPGMAIRRLRVDNKFWDRRRICNLMRMQNP